MVRGQDVSLGPANAPLLQFPHGSGAELRLSYENGLLGGVCAAIASWLGVNPTAVRILFVLVSIASVAIPGVFVYLLLCLLIPGPKLIACPVAKHMKRIGSRPSPEFPLQDHRGCGRQLPRREGPRW